MRINSNISLAAQNQLQRTEKAIARSLERLSTGQRVNSPRDDSAAYSMGVRLTSQIRGLAMTNLGINSALGMIETADGAVSTQIEIVQRMREVAVQAANGNLSTTERANLDLEVQALLSEYNRITTATSFNGTALVDGTFPLTKIQVGANQGNTIDLNIASSQANGVFVLRQTIGAGTFKNRTTIASGAGPWGVIATDVNGDGKNDILTVDRTDNTVSLSLGNGNGTFQTRVTFAVGVQVQTIEAIDVNSDHIIDLVTADRGDGTASILLGNGNGTFQSRITTSTGAAPEVVKLGDFNKDGKLDLIAVNNGSAMASLMLGNGNGTFQAGTTMVTSASPQDLTLADLNNDGNLDFVTADRFGNVDSIYLGNGNGTFQARTTISITSPRSVSAADFNHDGIMDLVTNAGTALWLSVSLGNGNGTFGAAVNYTVTGNPRNILVQDLNGDGNIDLVAGDGNTTTLSIFLGNGNGTFGSRLTYTTGLAPQFLYAADVNGDDVLDLLSSDNSDNTVSILIADTKLSTSVASVSVATQTKAQQMLQVFDNAIATLQSNRSNLAALHSRLDTTASYNLLVSESFEEARSNLLDTDFALETAELVRNQILEQAQIAVLAQANSQTSLAMKLLDNL